MVVQIKIDLEKICVAIFFAVLLFIAPGILFDHKIAHDFPYGYFASDAFQHQVRAENIKDVGNFRYESSYISVGFEKTVGRYPPAIYHIAVALSYASGLEVYDAIYFAVFFFSVIGVLLTYLLIRDFNKNIALISLPLSIITFSNPTLIGFTWGHWPSVLAQSFLIGFFWFVMKANLEKIYVLAALVFSGVLLAHTSEGVFGFIFVVLFLVMRLIAKRLTKEEAKNVVICIVLSFIISLHYLIIFENTWGDNKYSFAVEPVWNGNPGFYLIDFGILLVFILAGILFSLFKIKDMHISLIAAFAMLISGFLNYIGFGLRSFQMRFFWPIYLSIFFGFGIYTLLKFAIKKWNGVYSVLLMAILSILLLGIIKVPNIPFYRNVASQGIMDPYHWAALNWISKNSEQSSKIYFFFGNIYNQDAILRNTKRIHYLVNIQDFVSSIKDRKIKRNYISKFTGDAGGGFKIREGLFTFTNIGVSKPPTYFLGPQDICKFDYLVFDKATSQQVLAQYNMLIASELLKNSSMSKAFENEVVIILKNSNKGGDCIEERSF